ncbi:maternal protein exuperantia [Schistocerca piceifrons]|uniref:maternal protein exuperantia n=1 Tax=Schistocerca piceifrons TaxID=274613 RepID=UPI001F5FCC78|nr:maternal protein exuperantia [Schistocerca piceifrons]
MVSTTVTENGTESGKTVDLSAGGEYRLIGWDVDATGRTLIDEICQVAAYTPTDKFSQYIMPFGDLNPASRSRHNMAVVTIGRYRMLKDIKAGKVLKTKSEISALTDFVHWLEQISGKTKQSLILVSHENQKLASSLLLEALRKYNLLDRFCAVVKGFVNGFSVAEVKCAKTVKAFTLRTLSRVLLDKEEDLSSAVDRARLAYQIVHHLLDERQENKGSGDASVAVVESLKEFIWTLDKEEEHIALLKKFIERQNSLRPIFRPMMRIDRKESAKASALRRALAQAGVNYEDLSAAHSKDGSNGINELITSKVTNIKPNELEELKKIVNGHFNPESKKKSDETPQKVVPEKSVSEGASASSTPDTNNSPVKEPSTGANNTSATASSQSNDTSPQKSVNTGASSPATPESN